MLKAAKTNQLDAYIPKVYSIEVRMGLGRGESR